MLSTCIPCHFCFPFFKRRILWVRCWLNCTSGQWKPQTPTLPGFWGQIPWGIYSKSSILIGSSIINYPHDYGKPHQKAHSKPQILLHAESGSWYTPKPRMPAHPATGTATQNSGPIYFWPPKSLDILEVKNSRCYNFDLPAFGRFGSACHGTGLDFVCVLWHIKKWLLRVLP